MKLCMCFSLFTHCSRIPEQVVKRLIFFNFELRLHMTIRDLFYKALFWLNDFFSRLALTSGKIMCWTFPFFIMKLINPFIVAILERAVKNHILIEKFYFNNKDEVINDG